MISALDRLKELPDVFKGADVMRTCGWDSKRTNEMLARWKKKGWIDTLGKRLDVYTNNVKVPKDLRVNMMINKLDSNALDLSHVVWSEQDWTTQFSMRNIVASSLIVRDIETEDVYLKARPLRWWKTVYDGIIKKTDTEGIHKLKPEWLLAEALYSNDKDLWLPDPDDIDWYSVEETTNLDSWETAMKSLARYYRKDYLADNSIEDSYISNWNELKSHYPAYSSPNC